MIRNTDEQQMKGIQRKPGKVPSTGASLSVQLGCITLPRRWTTWKFLNPILLGIFMVASSCRHDQSLTKLSALLPFQENSRSNAESSKLLIMAWSFSSSEPSRSPPRVTSSKQNTPTPQEVTRFPGALWQEPGSKIQILEQKDVSSIFWLRKLQGFQKLCARN